MTRIISTHYASTSLCAYDNKRIISLDLAKGFTVLFIPAIHTVMLYSSTAVHGSWLGIVLGLIAEWPGAQLLMFVMGMSFSFSKKKTALQLKRALLIFIAGYGLNVLKFVFPLWLKLLPPAFLNDLHFSHDLPAAVNLFLIGDILQFAGIALAVMTVLKLSRYYAIICVLLIYMIIISAHLFWDFQHSNVVIDHLLHLLGGSIDDVFFPVFPWLVYPLTGLAIGCYLQGPSSVVPIVVSGCFLFVCGCVMQFLPFHFPETSFWRTYADKTIMHLGFVMVWMGMWLKVKGSELKAKGFQLPLVMIARMLSFCGRNITVIYLVQWVVIFWMLPWFGYQLLDVGESVIAISFVYVVVFGIVLLLLRVLTNNKQRL